MAPIAAAASGERSYVSTALAGTSTVMPETVAGIVAEPQMHGELVDTEVRAVADDDGGAQARMLVEPGIEARFSFGE